MLSPCNALLSLAGRSQEFRLAKHLPKLASRCSINSLSLDPVSPLFSAVNRIWYLDPKIDTLFCVFAAHWFPPLPVFTMTRAQQTLSVLLLVSSVRRASEHP